MNDRDVKNIETQAIVDQYNLLSLTRRLVAVLLTMNLEIKELRREMQALKNDVSGKIY